MEKLNNKRFESFKEAVLDGAEFVVITHKNCNDGLGVYLCCLSHCRDNNLADPTVIYMNYSDTLDLSLIEGKHVLIGDFSFDLETMKKIEEVAADYVLLDHHESARALEDLDNCYIDTTRSGAALVSVYLLEYMPLLIALIEDRDLWKFSIMHSKEINTALSTIDRNDIERWMILLRHDDLVYDLKDMGCGILTYQDNVVKSIISSSKLTIKKWKQYEVPFINTTTLISEIGSELAKTYPFAVMYFITGSEIVFSFRSSPTGVDLLELKVPRGHRNAAGRSIPLSDINLNELFATDNTGAYEDIGAYLEELLG